MWETIHQMVRILPGCGGRASTDAFINNMINLAIDAELSGQHDVALDLLGQAIHPIMDSSSPIHRDENGNPYVWGCGFACWGNNSRHSPNEWWGSETMAALDPSIFEDQDRRILDAYKKVFGKKKLSGRKN